MDYILGNGCEGKGANTKNWKNIDKVAIKGKDRLKKDRENLYA
jgi:hypothetical protein